MKKALFILIVLLISLLYYAGVLTRKESLPASKQASPEAISVLTNRPWDLRRAGPPSQEDLDQLYGACLDKGIKNAPIISSYLIREAERLRLKGDTDQAVRIAGRAVKFSPGFPEPYFEMARAHWHQNPFGLTQVFSDLFKGLRVSILHYPSSLRSFFGLLFILSHAILLTFVIFGIVLLVKYLPLYLHDFRTNLTHEMTRLLTGSLKILCLFIPFFLRLDMLWAILFWVVLLWGYITRRERQWILFFFIIIVYVPFILRASAAFLDGPSCGVLLGMSQANLEELDKPKEEELRAWLVAHPEDPEVLFTLGLAEKRRGRYAQAEEFYRKAGQQDPRSSGSLSNLGNVYLARNQMSAAISSYQRAIDLDPDNAAYHYNLYRAYSHGTFFSSKADEAFQKARRLNPELVDYYSNIDDPRRPTSANRVVIDEVLTPQALWKRTVGYFIGRGGALFYLFEAWFAKIPSRTTFLIPVLFLAFVIGMSRYVRQKRFLTRCSRCGSATYRVYLGDSGNESICFNCSHLPVRKGKSNPKMAGKRLLQGETFQRENRFIGRSLSYLIVGFDDLWKGDFLKGVILLFLFFIFLLRVIFWSGVIPSSVIQLPSAAGCTVFWGTLFVLFYLFSLRRVLRPRPRSGARPRQGK